MSWTVRSEPSATSRWAVRSCVRLVTHAADERSRTQFGGMKADDVKRVKELEAENQRLKRIVADQVLENQALKEIAKGNW